MYAIRVAADPSGKGTLVVLNRRPDEIQKMFDED
jgi:hypothetical protein